MRFTRVRDVLNRLRWDSRELDYAILTVEDRVSGAKEVSGSSIVRLGHREFDVSDAEGGISTVPYYKVTSVVVGDEVIWERPRP